MMSIVHSISPFYLDPELENFFSEVGIKACVFYMSCEHVKLLSLTNNQEQKDRKV